MSRIPHISEPLFDAGTQKINDNWFRYLDGLVAPAAVDAVDAEDVAYDNTTSGLTATDVQAAVDEVEGRVDALEADPGGGAVALTNINVFTSSGTWNKPTGLHHVVVHVVGGGRGLTGNGGTSSFGAHCSATGGTGTAGGAGSGGDVNMTGGIGVANVLGGGAPGPFGGPARGIGGNGLNYGGGAHTNNNSGGGGYAMKRIAEAALAASEAVTIGAGGTGTQTGAPGIVVVEEYTFI